MKTALTAIALGAILASASHATFAGPTSTTTQTGIGNSAYTEQSLVDPAALASATIIQIGNNNHAGDPVAQNPGILQRNIGQAKATAMIEQLGNENTGTIVQDGTHHFAEATITQTGAGNSAAIAQNIVTFTTGSLHQEGTGNVATLQQEFTDLGFQGIQNGSGNVMSVRQHDASHSGASVTQTGSQNAAYVDHDGTLGGAHIVQTGSLNTVYSTMTHDVFNGIDQTGTGNTATTRQVDGDNSSTIAQTGNDNLAALSQTGGTGNYSLITQIGNSNQATMSQTQFGLQPNTAYINQVGNGFVASITQSGSDNHAGTNQH